MIKMDSDIQNQIMMVENLKDAIETYMQKLDRERFAHIDDHMQECRD